MKNKYSLLDEIKSDVYRYEGKCDLPTLLRSFLLSHLGFRITVFYRVANYLYRRNIVTLAKIFSLLYRFVSKRYGVEIPYTTNIGLGLYLPHPFCIVVNSNCIIGNNCNLHQGVTIGEGGRGDNKCSPVIGNRIYFGPGSKIFGNITIKNNCAIGANCILNRNSDENEVLVGVPARKISSNGTEGLLKNIIQYEDKKNGKNQL